LIGLKYKQPTLDPKASQSLTLISANYSEGVTSLEFIRDLKTGDQYDQPISVDEVTTFIWALNPTYRAVPASGGSTFVKHNADTKGRCTQRFFRIYLLLFIIFFIYFVYLF